MATGSDSSVPSSSLSPSLGPSHDEQVAATVSGQPRRSPVLEYFMYNSETDKSICQIEVCTGAEDYTGMSSDSSMKLCGHAMAGKFPTNLK